MHVCNMARGAASPTALLRVIAKEDDSRPRLWRLMRADWDWTPLINCLDLTVRGLGSPALGFGASRV